MTEFRVYQEAGIDWLVAGLNKFAAVMLADEAGLGKSAQALEAAHRLDVTRLLIICPAGVRRVWAAEIARWHPEWNARVFVVEPGSRLPRSWLAHSWLGDPTRPLILIAAYDAFSEAGGELPLMLTRKGAPTWDMMILDEAHYLKGASNRTFAIYGRKGTDEGVQVQADRVVLLTGTPCPNHVGELYQHIRTFWPEVLPGNGSQAAYEDRYTRYKDTVWGRQIYGSQHQADLKPKLAPVVLRRRKREVLMELPPVVVQDVPLDTDLMFRATTGFDLPADEAELLAVLRRPDAALAELRRKIGMAKILPSVSWIAERLASAEKILVFAWHVDVIAGLARGLMQWQPAVITGDTTPRARDLEIVRFQEDPNCRVFVGQILAAGTGITLTAASEVVMVEASWVPGENHQSICRAHRLGQRDSVLASFLYLPDTLDQTVMAVFRRKAAELAELTGDE